VPIASEPLSVVLLAHNQASHLEAVLSNWITFLNGLDREYEVLVVDGGSTDGAEARAVELASQYRRVQVLRQTERGGDGAALRSALAVARYPLLFYTRCDPAYQPADLGKLLRKRSDPNKPELEIDQVHIMTAARGGGPVPWPWRFTGLLWRIFCRLLFGESPERLSGWLGWRWHLIRAIIRVLFGVRYHDVFCPFRLHRREVFERIPLQSDGPFVHVEILAKANYLGRIMGEEVPLEPGHYPPLDPKPSRETLGQMLADARRVFFRPDFGPVRVESVTVPKEAGTGARETPAPES
jgi:glycosyltransferase involved in cell wall biosynthesis